MARSASQLILIEYMSLPGGWTPERQGGLQTNGPEALWVRLTVVGLVGRWRRTRFRGLHRLRSHIVDSLEEVFDDY